MLGLLVIVATISINIVICHLCHSTCRLTSHASPPIKPTRTILMYTLIRDLHLSPIQLRATLLTPARTRAAGWVTAHFCFTYIIVYMDVNGQWRRQWPSITPID